jgi:hypothetical protein
MLPGGSHHAKVHMIKERKILQFMRNHPEEINLAKVDRTWFLDLVLLRGRSKVMLGGENDGEQEGARDVEQ